MAIDARIYYPNESSPGIVIQIINGYVFEAGEGGGRRLADYQYGKFVRLVEVQEEPEKDTVKK